MRRWFLCRVVLSFMAITWMPGQAELAADSTADIVTYLNTRSVPLHSAVDLDPLMQRIGDARIVLLGESSHGTSEYYTWRKKISQRLITEKGFDFIVVEGDWPSCYGINRYVKHLPDAPPDIETALAGFRRWPPWMWANEEVAVLAEWMAAYNSKLDSTQRVGFYGLDVYSLVESMDAVVDYAREHAPDLAGRITTAYRCLEPYRADMMEYARYTQSGRNCSEQVQAVLTLLRGRAAELSEQDGKAYFRARQNAHIVKRGEMHYRAMADPEAMAWNKRAEHMKKTLTRLLDKHAPDARAVVWAHNTHVGDARATGMAGAGMTNIGWMTRDTYGLDDVVIVGFSTHRGQVLAGRQWGGDRETMTIPPARGGSIEDIFNRLDHDTLMVVFDDDVPAALNQPIGHRAKGTVYNPEDEARNYVPTILPRRYDAFIFIAETTPLTSVNGHSPDWRD